MVATEHTSSVVITVTTYNDAARIEACIQSCLAQQGLARIALVVADDGSTDATLKILHELAAHVDNLHILALPHGERGHARAAALEKALTLAPDFLLFIDSDMTLPAELVQRCVAYALHQHYGALVIPERAFSQSTNFFTRVKVFERNIINNAGATYNGAHSIEGARFWQTAAYLLSGGFHPQQIAFEDTQPTLRYLARGGRVRNFLNPFAAPLALLRLVRGGFYADCRDRLYAAVAGWRLRYYFSLGVRGFVGAFAWLVVPVALLGQGHRNPALGIAGAALLAGVVLYLPFLQARFARDNQIRAYRALRTVRHDFRRAPLAFAFALAFQLLAACPLYLLKIEAIPRDLVFLEGFVFLLFMFPARLFAGWAYARAARRTTPRHFVWRWVGRFAVLPVVAAYVLVVFLSQHIGWHGAAGLFEQHAFLLPVPFTDLAGK